MKIIFEYKDGFMFEVIGLKLHTINQTSPMNAIVDACLNDTDVINMYIIANDNSIRNEITIKKTADELMKDAIKHMLSLEV